jgi:hypothetical protein
VLRAESGRGNCGKIGKRSLKVDEGHVLAFTTKLEFEDSLRRTTELPRCRPLQGQRG